MKHDDSLPTPFACLLRRLLVIGLCASFFLCLLVVGITTNFLSDVQMHLPVMLQIYMRRNVVVVLSVPAVVLILFCIALYYITRDIISGPARYLDERQQLLRDKAYHSSYRIIILVCVVVGTGLILHATLFPPVSTTVVGFRSVIFNSMQSAHASLQVSYTALGHTQKETILYIPFVRTPQTTIETGVGSANSLSTAIWSYTTLLISLLLLISTLPRSVIAWKKQM